MNQLKYLNKARYLHAAAGIVMMLLGVAAAALVFHQVKHHQAGFFQATLSLTGAIIIALGGLALTTIYLRP